MCNYKLSTLRHLILTTVAFSIEGRLFTLHIGNALKLGNASTFTITSHHLNPWFNLHFSAPFLCRDPLKERLTASTGSDPSNMTQRP